MMSVPNYLNVVCISPSSSTSSSYGPVSSASASAPCASFVSGNVFFWSFFLFFDLLHFLFGWDCWLEFFSVRIFVSRKWRRYGKFPCGWTEWQILILAKWTQSSRSGWRHGWNRLGRYFFHETVCYRARTWFRSASFWFCRGTWPRERLWTFIIAIHQVAVLILRNSLDIR